MVCIAGCFAACSKDKPDSRCSGEIPKYEVTAAAMEQFKLDTTAIRKFVTDNKIADVKKDENGVFYQILAPGTGSHHFTVASNISIDYEGKLLNGNVFDSSKGSYVTFQLCELIPGWNIGVPKIQKGGKVRLLIPSYFCYGPRAVGTVPPNAVLDFTISLNNVN
ncbi:FKBP-type peptidyl-prolyl cis-trans isomerase [Pedobacter caeni]|uniref:Peptidyl-prolyl cis-trans isomerase n=2 Tax=Pedobacter caeni TaxID=288992 RepID=A0A1M5ADY1_9SPHI|nr:FKBP-type peptidyl-prolyl cis-trans isomerase [Pedobacter caeni]